MSNTKKNSGTKNDNAWEELFQLYDIVDKIKSDGTFEITSKQINKFREARLMTKFDHRRNLPKIFLKHKLAILPISRGSYIIGRFKLYEKFPEITWKNELNSSSERFIIPEYLQSLGIEGMSSEAIAINAAYSTNALAKFLGEKELLPTVSGRMGTGDFSFWVNESSSKTIEIFVKKAQMEIDGGFEGLNSLALIEAKSIFAEDFLIRQLYYPFKIWTERISKPVRPIYQVFSNNTLFFYEYEFLNSNDYNSLQLKRTARYRFQDKEICMNDVINLVQTISPKNNKSIPFPQANSFERVISLCELVQRKKSVFYNSITRYYGFDKRQTGYYTNAALYLGLLKKTKTRVGVSYSLSSLGKDIFSQKFSARQLSLTRAILEHSVFYDAFYSYIENLERPSKELVMEMIWKHGAKNVGSEKTVGRRADTVLRWVDWIIALPD